MAVASSALGAPAASPEDQLEALRRVVSAEAGDQSDDGMAAVIFVILNRIRSGRWGRTVVEVVDAKGQFEPVSRAGGTWRLLRPPTPAERLRIDAVLRRALFGALRDPTGGALYFQNPKLVAARVRAGLAPAVRLDFGGASPSAVIHDHSFYREVGPSKSEPGAPRTRPIGNAASPIFFRPPSEQARAARGP